MIKVFAKKNNDLITITEVCFDESGNVTGRVEKEVNICVLSYSLKNKFNSLEDGKEVELI